ncbi:ATP-dependent zinc metalloprotease FtsH [Rufibacter radiotolerans]|uniref:ATP-dependent zinc metalloprotease FtsH n=1 Tax=Rufibacter radiotolerans TaxID=1379910 RepID=UPI0009E51F27|nr:ATP-dependent zinc metalloprotease FtsH [Rufibacter radiotolerans]
MVEEVKEYRAYRNTVADPTPHTDPTPNKPPQSRVSPMMLYVLFMGILIFTMYNSGNSARQATSWLEVEKYMLSRKAIDKIEVINGEEANIFIKKEFADSLPFKDVMKPGNAKQAAPGPHYSLTIGSVESFEHNLEQAQQGVPLDQRVEVVYIKQENWFGNMILWLFPIFLMVMFWQFLMRNAGAGGGSSIFSFGKSKAMLFDKEHKSKITFNDVAGLEEAAMEVKEVVDFLKSPEAFTKLGAKIPKGVILVGPPGTGKTLLAKAMAGEAQVPFFSMSGSEFVEMFVGVGASRVRDLFKQAKEKAPCIIFIDEIDSIGQSRGKQALFSGSNDERESTLNQLLTEMDGFETNSGVIVLAATNRADLLDPALIRPGRFDRHIYLELPNIRDREEIFKVHLRPLKIDQSIDPGFLAAQTPGFSGADIANVCNEAALIAARKKKESIDRQDFLDAMDRIVAGLEKKSKIISPEEKKIIAYHESGHAIVSWLLPHVDPLIKVSIIPRGKSLGAAWYLPEEHQLKSATAFSEHLSAILAGRAAEEVTFGEVTSGALDDLEKATKEAYMMVAYYGFDKQIGNISFYDSTGQQDTRLSKPYSEETGKLIDAEVMKLINDAYGQAKNILVQQKEALGKLAERLLQKEVIFKEDLEEILGKRSAPLKEVPVLHVV